jgi:hypothetical protein
VLYQFVLWVFLPFRLRSFAMEDIQLSATRYSSNALIQLSPTQIVSKLNDLDEREHGSEALEDLGT